MDITPDQRTYARLVGICILANIFLQAFGDSVTKAGPMSASFAETARYAAESAVLYRVALLAVAVAWIVIGIVDSS
jgi:hypothetical protein